MPLITQSFIFDLWNDTIGTWHHISGPGEPDWLIDKILKLYDTNRRNERWKISIRKLFKKTRNNLRTLVVLFANRQKTSWHLKANTFANLAFKTPLQWDNIRNTLVKNSQKRLEKHRFDNGVFRFFDYCQVPFGRSGRHSLRFAHGVRNDMPNRRFGSFH